MGWLVEELFFMVSDSDVNEKFIVTVFLSKLFLPAKYRLVRPSYVSRSQDPSAQGIQRNQGLLSRQPNRRRRGPGRVASGADLDRTRLARHG